MTTIAPLLSRVHGTHSDGETTLVVLPAGPDGSTKSPALESDAANRVALSISRHSTPTINSMMPTARNSERHTRNVSLLVNCEITTLIWASALTFLQIDFSVDNRCISYVLRLSSADAGDLQQLAADCWMFVVGWPFDRNRPYNRCAQIELAIQIGYD